ncbi:MAG TPA: hypothetical protein VFC19_54450 [Candidatus Limnocylindrales bacterium]|nr:hypothetical protein [Candidatus Limnocylindrales bacterium]
MELAQLRTGKEARSVLTRLRAEGDRFAGRLRALEAHPGFRRLRAMTSGGTTLRAWEQTRAITDELSAQLRTYRSTLDRAETLLSSRTRLSREDLAQLSKILCGPVDLPMPPSGPAEQRDLAALLVDMTSAHAEVLQTVTDVEEYFTALQKRLNQLADSLRSLHNRVVSLTFRDDGAASLVDGLARELAEVSQIALADPLGCVGGAGDRTDDPVIETQGGIARARLSRLSAAVSDASTHLSAVQAQQSEMSRSIVGLHRLVTEVELAEQDCLRTDTEVRSRIAEPDLETLDSIGPAMRQRLNLVDRRRAEGDWPRLAGLIKEIEQGCAAAQEAARVRRAAARALLDQRDELRGRLASYRAMAVAYGHAEDLDLTDEYERTYRILWTAPCDLRQADAGVARYQAAVIARTEQVRSGAQDIEATE